jgi:phosphatidylglycerol---prolipoprotein diacylglyceryl transferase
MFPVLFSFGSFTLYTMNVFYVLAFLLTGYVFWRRGKEEHYAEDELFDGFLLALIWGIVWSRIGFIAVHYSNFGLNLLKWIDVFSYPGVLPIAGFALSALFLFKYAKRNKWNSFEILDFAALASSAGMSVIWLGAFLDGSGVGTPTRLPWGVMFRELFDKRHPVQIYGMILYILLFMFLSWAESRYRTFNWYRDKKHSAQTGFLFCVFCIAFGLFGIVLGLVSSPQITVFGFALDLPVRIAILIYGLLLLYTRTGRTLLPQRKFKVISSEAIS